MSKNQTDNSRYPSKYAEGFVTAAQYITELICEKLAKTKKKKIGLKFWENQEWATFYKQQIIVANGLLRIYSEKAIIAALNNKRAWNIYSLRAPHLDKIIQEEECKIKELKTDNIIQIIDKENPTRRKTNNNNKTIFSKLRDIDNDKNNKE